jgi:hypothetical protein
MDSTKCASGHVTSVWIPQKVCLDTLRQTCVFAYGGICRSRSAFQCIRGAKRRCTIFVLGLDPYRFHKMSARRCYAELVFLHPVGSMAHLVHSGASRAQNIDALFLMLG